MGDALQWALSGNYYTDPDIYAREQERVFRRSWQYAGHISMLENAGDYFAFDLHGRSLFCVLGRDGELRTFYNVCAHRAHRLGRGASDQGADRQARRKPILDRCEPLAHLVGG